MESFTRWVKFFLFYCVFVIIAAAVGLPEFFAGLFAGCFICWFDRFPAMERLFERMFG